MTAKKMPLVLQLLALDCKIPSPNRFLFDGFDHYGELLGETCQRVELLVSATATVATASAADSVPTFFDMVTCCILRADCSGTRHNHGHALR